MLKPDADCWSLTALEKSLASVPSLVKAWRSILCVNASCMELRRDLPGNLRENFEAPLPGNPNFLAKSGLCCAVAGQFSIN